MESSMNLSEEVLEQIHDDIVRHEGCVAKIYLDSEGLETFGIGHLVIKSDPEYGKPVGTPVSERRVTQAFSADLSSAIKDCEQLFPMLDTYPTDVQRVLVNMTFNLGKSRFSKFKKMRAAVICRDFETAADEMMDSKWYRQVGNRAKELVGLMRSANG